MKKKISVSPSASWRHFINSLHKLFSCFPERTEEQQWASTLNFYEAQLCGLHFLSEPPGSSLLHHAGRSASTCPNSWCWQTWQCALSWKLQHMARGFGDASCPIFSSASAPPLIWSTCVAVKRLTTSETEETLSCFLGILTTPNSFFFHLMCEAVFPSSLFENWLVIFVFSALFILFQLASLLSTLCSFISQCLKLFSFCSFLVLLSQYKK